MMQGTVALAQPHCSNTASLADLASLQNVTSSLAADETQTDFSKTPFQARFLITRQSQARCPRKERDPQISAQPTSVGETRPKSRTTSDSFRATMSSCYGLVCDQFFIVEVNLVSDYLAFDGVQDDTVPSPLRRMFPLSRSGYSELKSPRGDKKGYKTAFSYIKQALIPRQQLQDISPVNTIAFRIQTRHLPPPCSPTKLSPSSPPSQAHPTPSTSTSPTFAPATSASPPNPTP